ncbi:hypothetical protein IKG68_03055 [Candidatus Saccharibacteria bacterium]|nr:hypothetical protein [Candidatus Saccharibacteria bacterium]
MKVIQNKLNKTKLVAGIAAILLFATIYNICKIPTSATAESNTSTYGLTATSESSLEISIVSPESPLSIKPTGGDGTFNSEQITVKVGTNNTTGYKLTMSADTTSLSRSPAGSGSIPTLESAVTEAEFPVNHWGFMRTTDNNTFQPMKAGEAIYINATGTQNDITESAAINNITFGVKLNNAIPMGNYSISLNFVATTNPVPMTMQDVTSSILAEYMPNIGDTYTLRDSRDNRDYLIKHLPDDRYWMVEKLQFEGTTLTPADSNVAETTMLAWHDLVTEASNASGACYGEEVNGTDGKIITGSGVTTPCKGRNNTYSGVYYNIAGASAGTVTESPMTKNMEYNICPAHWTLPSYAEAYRMRDSIGQGNGLMLSYGYGGYYSNGTLYYAGNAYYWQKNTPITPYVYMMVWWINNMGEIGVENSMGNTSGLSIQCIFSGE